MKADFKKWAKKHKISLWWFEPYFDELNQFAEEYAKQCMEEAFEAGVAWGNECADGHEPHFDEWYNQKFKDDKAKI